MKNSEEQPEFPITVKFDDGDVWEFENVGEIACTLEWFNSDDPEEEAIVFDNKNRKVRVKVDELNLTVFELE